MKLLKSILILGLFSTLGFAQDPETENEEGEDVINPRSEKLGKAFDISADSVQFLKDEFKIGYGGVSKALAMASKTDYTAEEILAMKTEDKMGWGNIAKKLNLKEGKDWKTPAVPEDEQTGEVEEVTVDEEKLKRAQRKNKGLAKKQARVQSKLERAQAKANRKQNKHKK